MEEIKSDRWILVPTDRFTLPLMFKFTADEIKKVKKILRSFDSNSVQNFLFFLSGVQFIPLFAVFKMRTFPKDAIEGHLKSLRQCTKTIKKIIRGFDPDPQKNFDSTRDPKIRLGKSPWNICFENAMKALPHIETIEKTFEEILAKEKRRRGRPQADQEGFISEIAKLYKTFFGKEPSGNKGGIFWQLINTLFTILDPKENGNVYDMSRAIRRTVKGRRKP